MTQSLPVRPNLVSLKKQAKQLLKQSRNNETTALEVINSYHPSPSAFSSLRDAQLTIARKYGFDGWQSLKTAVEDAVLLNLPNNDLLEQYIALSCVQYNSDDSDKRYKRANRLLALNPALASASFVSSVVSNNLSEVKKRLNKNRNLAIEKFGPNDWTALMYLAYGRIDEDNDDKKSLEIAKLLIESGADVNAYYLNMDIYHYAVLTGVMGEGEGGVINQPPHQHAKEFANIILDAGAEANDCQGLYDTMFTESADYWLPVLVAYGLDNKSPVNWNQNKPPSMVLDFLIAHAVSTDKIDRVKYLLSMGADVNTICSYTSRALLTIAIVNQHNSIKALLLEAGAEKVELTQEQLFSLAVTSNDYENIDNLLIEQPSFISNSALVQGTNVAVLKYLIKRGLDINQQAENGRTLMHLLAIHGKLAELKYLITQGANLELKDKDFQATVLAFAHFNNQIEVRDYLLERSDNILELSACGFYRRMQHLININTELVNTKSTITGNTPLHLVCNWLSTDSDCGLREKIMDLLIMNGADINAKNDRGQTPLDLYQQENDDENIELILERSST